MALSYIDPFLQGHTSNPKVLLSSTNHRQSVSMRGSRGGGGTGGHDLPENHKNIVFSNTRPDPLKNHKATKPALNVGLSLACQRNAI